MLWKIGGGGGGKRLLVVPSPKPKGLLMQYIYILYALSNQCLGICLRYISREFSKSVGT